MSFGKHEKEKFVSHETLSLYGQELHQLQNGKGSLSEPVQAIHDLLIQTVPEGSFVSDQILGLSKLKITVPTNLEDIFKNEPVTIPLDLEKKNLRSYEFAYVVEDIYCSYIEPYDVRLNSYTVPQDIQRIQDYIEQLETLKTFVTEDSLKVDIAKCIIDHFELLKIAVQKCGGTSVSGDLIYVWNNIIIHQLLIFTSSYCGGEIPDSPESRSRIENELAIVRGFLSKDLSKIENGKSFVKHLKSHPNYKDYSDL